MQRRVQHYGWRYDYRARIVTPDMRIGPFPAWLNELAVKFRDAGIFPTLPDQAIVNEYEPGQGIAMHVDRHRFGPVVATISLGDAWQMHFRPARKPRAASLKQHYLLQPGSVLALTDDARYRWLHRHRRPPARKNPDGASRARSGRVSVTFPYRAPRERAPAPTVPLTAIAQ